MNVSLSSKGWLTRRLWACSDLFVPGVFSFATRTFPLGTADALNRGRPDPQEGAEDFASHAVTPVADKATRYFYILGARRRGDETTYNAADVALTERAFAEDKMMIEAQQRNIDSMPGYRFRSTTADKGVILFNRLVEKLAREESAQVSQASQPVSPHRSDIKSSNSVV